MALRLSPVVIHGGNLAIVVGAFLPNGNGAITQSANVSGSGTGAMAGFTAAHSGTLGIYNIDLMEPFPALVVLFPELVNAIGFKVEAFTPPGSIISSLGGRRVQVRTADETGSTADIAASAGRYIQFMAVFRRRVV